MNHTRYTKLPLPRAWRWGALLILLATVVVWLAGGCADPRTAPLPPSEPGYSVTKVLWENEPSNGNIISTNFTVDRELAPISDPENDVPARLTVVAYFRPDADVDRYEHIISSEIPPLRAQIIDYLVQLEQRTRLLDSLSHLDSLCSANPDSCTLFNPPIDSTTFDAQIVQLQADTASLNAQISATMADTTNLGLVRDSLGHVADNRFNLALWLDGDTLAKYPEAVFIDQNLTLAGQGLFLAATDPLTGYKGRRFSLDMNRFEAAAANDIGLPQEINWTECPLGGGDRPCLSVGSHTLRARVTGADSRITATLVLVYAENNP